MKTGKRFVALVLVLMMFLALPAESLAGSHSATIASIHSSFVSGNLRANSAPQQAANGAYRMVELLEVIADEYGVSASIISSIHSSYVSGNLRANSAPQQLANGN